MGVNAEMMVLAPSACGFACDVAGIQKRFADAFPRFRLLASSDAAPDPYEFDEDRNHFEAVHKDQCRGIPRSHVLVVYLDGERYYGIGYERGSWQTIIAVGDWLAAEMPDCPLFYGVDTGASLEPFGARERALLRAYAEGPNGDNYHKRVAAEGERRRASSN